MTEGLIGEIVREKVYSSSPRSDKWSARDIGDGRSYGRKNKKSVKVASRPKKKQSYSLHIEGKGMSDSDALICNALN